VHKKLWLWVLRSVHWEIFSQKGIQNTTKCLWWFWSSNTRLQVHYRHCQPLSHVVWQHYWNSGIYTTFDSIIPTYTDLYLLIQIIPTYTCNTYRYGAVSRPLIIMPYNNVITKGIIQNLRYCHIPINTDNTYWYLLIPRYTSQYLEIHAYTCQYLPSCSWNSYISATNDPFDMSQRTVLITVSNRQMGLVCGTFYLCATIWMHIENWARRHSLVHQNSNNNPPISA
jgi:hypothetical protein